MIGICVVHLVWAPLGPEPLRRFLAAYADVDAGAPHELCVVFNGFQHGDERGPFEQLLEPEHRALNLTDPVQDLAAYRAAIDATEAERVCFLNSYARPLVDGWLATLDEASREPEVGLVGASGSWESAASSAPAVLKASRWMAFPRFPNPHLRTNGFFARRGLLQELDWGGVDSKLGALKLESGRRSLTRQVRRRGLRTVVVGRDGLLTDPEDWPRSATFRSGQQANLLIADNRTDDYAEADAAEQQRLGRMAWGRRAWAVQQ